MKKPREIRLCGCGCGKSREVIVTSKWTYFRNHTKRIKRETRLCECGCGKSFECKVNSTQRFISGHNNKGKHYTKGYKWIHNPVTNKEKNISQNLVSEYLSNGWVKGKSSSHIENNRPTKESIQKIINTRKKRYGTFKHSEATILKIKAPRPQTRGRVLVYNPLTSCEKHLDPKISLDYINRGWVTGFSVPHRKKLSVSSGGTGIPGEFSPYSEKFDRYVKECIRKRSNYSCQICGMTEEVHLQLFRSHLHCHHIDYNKLNNELDNLVALCKSCHAKTSRNRSYWRELFKSKMNFICGIK